MAGGPSRALSHWQVSIQSQWIVGVVGSGFRLLWKDGKAPLARRPPAFKPPSSQEAISVLRAEIASLVQKGAVEEVLNHSSPGFYGRLFAVPKASGAWRPVLDLSFLNTFLREIGFKMETPASVRDSLRPGDWATSIDLTDAYFHVLVHPADRKWLRFRWASQVYQFRALPFGLSLAPWVFTMVVRQFCALVRSRGVRLRAYLDDWLITNQSQAGCEQDTQAVLREANRLGFSINRVKSELTPCQTFTYLGMSFDTVAWTVHPSQKRVDKLQALIRSTLLLQRASLRTLASILGQMESMALLVPLGRVHKRPFQLALKPFVDSPTVDWNALIPLQGWFQSTTLPWLDTEWVCRGVPIALPAPDLDLFTDASLVGWGAHTDRLTASGLWSADQRMQHINLLELEAKPQVDLFATRFSKRLPVFVSPFPDPEAWETNAMDISWSGLEAYAFPPFQLLTRVIRKAEQEGPSLLLIAPLWPSQPWFPDLLRLAQGPPIPLALTRGELIQPHTGSLHAEPQLLNLHAWRLFGLL
ncbi:uncharacterized protein [Littorina saxatilis]|uniref:uncharacterized protein n=1 Tax=Littorina saxatilis TaxID=31220 RepID=UPI0038B5206C